MTTTVERFDAAAPRGKARKDNWGNFHVPALFVTEGVCKYRKHDGTVSREYKPADEIYSPAFLDSLRSATLTDGHPTLAVTPENSGEYDCGHVKETLRQDDDGLVGEVVAKNPKLIAKVTAGAATQVSIGLNCVMDNTPGVWVDSKGVKHPYDSIQRAMTANHVAIVKNARVSGASLRLDSASMIVEPTERQTIMTTENLMRLDVGDGGSVNVPVDVGHTIKSYIATLITAGRELKEQKATLQTRADEADAKSKELEEKLAEIKAVDIDALVDLRTETIRGARKLMKDDEVDALIKDKKSNVEIRKAACAAKEEKLDGKDDIYVQATFDQLVKHAERATKNDQADDIALITSKKSPPSGDKTTAQRFDEAMRELHGNRKAAS